MVSLEVVHPATAACPSPPSSPASSLSSSYASSESRDESSTPVAVRYASSGSSDESSTPATVRSRCMHPGRRIIGGRIYDSILGVTCHWCRQKTVEDHVFCCKCTIAFCGGCLRNRHGEDIRLEMKDDVKWTCPKCRGGCGEGCNNCCNCGPCRKAQGMEPTGQIVRTARLGGFSNVHDYLVHQEIGESAEVIAQRKQGKGWCQTASLSPYKKPKMIEDNIAVTSASCRKLKGLDATPTPTRKATIVQPKPEPALGDSRTNIAGEKTPILQSDSNHGLMPRVLFPHKQSEDGGVSHGKVKSVFRDSESQRVPVKKEPSDPSSVPPPKRTLESPPSQLLSKTLRQERLAQPMETKEEPILHMALVKEEPEEPTLRMVHVKEEPKYRCRQRSCENVTAGQPNIFATAFSRGESDAVWCRFSANFEFPFVKDPLSACTSAEVRQNGGNLTASNAESYHQTSSSNFLNVKKEIADEQQHTVRGVAHNVEALGDECHDVCNAEGSPKEAMVGVSPHSCSYNERPIYCVTAKEEQEECWNHRASIQRAPTGSPCSSLPSTLKNKAENQEYRGLTLGIKCTAASSLPSSLPCTVRVKVEREDSRSFHMPSTCFNDGKDKVVEATHVNAETAEIQLSETIGLDRREVQMKKKIEALPPGRKGNHSAGAEFYPWKGNNFKTKLEAKLSEPFSMEELQTLDAAARHRKPIYRVRQTRQGCSQFASEEEGYSYLDHHPELAMELNMGSLASKLSLLRGFFFWLEHASMQGAFKPWITTHQPKDSQDDDDCFETDGPDCEILAVVCSVDEEM